MERLKFLSRDRQSLFKFEGFGHFGEIIRERSARVAAAGFGCPPEDCGDGMTRYPVIAGVCETGDFASSSDLERIAEYCAFRVSEFSVANSIPSQLAEMVQFNLNSEFSIDLDLQCLNGTNQTLVDGRMQPHEWIRRPDGVLMKVDASSHGDDHFFPGPTDIAWDVAGAIVEWRLGTDAAKFLINRYTTLSGDHIRPRIQPFIAAYSTFRFAYCHMALGTGMSSEDGAKLRAAAEYYRAVCERAVESLHSLRK